MSWAEAKHAINSNLGKEKFSPINEMIEYNTEVTVIASSEKLAMVIRSDEQATEQKKSKSYRFGVDAEIAVKYTGIGDERISLIVSVYKNDEEVYRKELIGTDTYQTLKTPNIYFEKGDTIKFEYSKHPNYLSYDSKVRSVAILGTAKPKVAEVIS